jgi:hypothetical protein
LIVFGYSSPVDDRRRRSKVIAEIRARNIMGTDQMVSKARRRQAFEFASFAVFPTCRVTQLFSCTGDCFSPHVAGAHSLRKSDSAIVMRPDCHLL